MVTSGLTGLRLSGREAEILQLVWDGLVTKEIADRLEISCHTVDHHRRSMIRKLGARNSVHLIRLALNHQLLRL